MIIEIKNKTDIDGFVRVGKILAQIFSAINPFEFNNTLEINSYVEDLCIKHKVNPTFRGYDNYPYAICASINEVLVHGIPNTNIIKENDVISIDIGIDVNGYIADSAKTFTKEESHLSSCCNKSLYSAISAARPNNSLHDICEALYSSKNKYTTPKDYGGHGINRYSLHVAPFVNAYKSSCENFLLRPGMIMAIEPMLIDGPNDVKVLQDGWSIGAKGLCAHFEHTILITENEPVILTEA